MNPPRLMPSVRPRLLFLLGLAFALRALLCWHGRAHWIRSDTNDYFRMADAIQAHHPFSFFPNGYPLLIAALKAVLPEARVPVALIGLNVVFSTATVGLVFLLARRLTNNPQAALGAAFLAALYPNQLDYVPQLLTEAPTAFLLTLGIACLVVWPRAAASGGCLALAAAFRATLALTGPCLLLIGLFLKQPKAELGRLAVGLLLGWLVFFALERAHVVEPSSNLNANLLIAIHSDSRRPNFHDNDDPPAQLKAAPRTYLNFAAAHPRQFLAQRALALWELWGPLPSAEGEGGGPGRARGLGSRLLIGLRFPLLLLALGGGWLRRRDFSAWALLTPILILTLIHTLTFATARFSYPVEPLMIVLATVAVYDRQCSRAREKVG